MAIRLSTAATLTIQNFIGSTFPAAITSRVRCSIYALYVTRFLPQNVGLRHYPFCDGADSAFKTSPAR